METKCATPTNRNRTVLAAAIAIVLCGPVHAADPKPTMSQYDSAVTYADYRDQKGGYKLRASDLIGREIEPPKRSLATSAKSVEKKPGRTPRKPPTKRMKRAPSSA